jgi:hypothetical protein
MKLLDNNNPKHIRKHFINYIEEIIKSYEGLDLKDVDKNLLSGILF